MDTMSAFMRGEASRGKTLMVFDWEEAARRIKRVGAANASAGLGGDWEYTGGPILADGKPVPSEDTYVYLASTWAVPELEINGDWTEPCWRYQDESNPDDWGPGTYWPESARRILAGDEP